MKTTAQPNEILHTENTCTFQNIETVGLTPRRREALALRTCGLTYKRCAQLMGCSADNVKNRIEDLYFEFGVNNTAQLITKAIRTGALRILTLIFAAQIALASPSQHYLRTARNSRPPYSREMRVAKC
jgi:DNA-binding CsgD family transcriptional regulator